MGAQIGKACAKITKTEEYLEVHASFPKYLANSCQIP